MQITFDTSNEQEVADVLRLIGTRVEGPNDAERLMRHLRSDKQQVLATIARLCEDGAMPLASEVATELDIPLGTLTSHKMNIGRTIKKLSVSSPIQTMYPEGRARYRMDERTRQAVLSCST